MSLSGDVRLATTERVRAALLAPRGWLQFSGGADVLGSVMTASLDNLPEACARPGSRSIAWDRALDPLDPELVARSYRVFVSGRRDQTIERHE